MARSSDIQNRICESILNKVQSGDMEPGSRLVERELAESLGVSRIPVREALTRLVAQGLLTGGRNGQGVWVREYTSEDIRQLYYFRGVVEGGIVRLAAQRGESDDLSAASICCDRMESMIEQDDFVQWTDMDYKYHISLAQSGGNERLRNTVEMLLSESHYLFYRHAAPQKGSKPSKKVLDEKKRVLGEHRDLLNLILQGKADFAETRVRETMAESAERICRIVIASEVESAVR